jgi:uncharacterized membrane protein YkvA (DUF1232 family)
MTSELTKEITNPADGKSALPELPPTFGGAMGAVLFALAYFAWPLDVIPDLLIGAGQVDDFGVLAWACWTVIRWLKG